MIKGVHHIGASVSQLDETMRFYKEAVDLKASIYFEIANNRAIDQVVNLTDVRCRAAMLSGQTTYLELIEFESPAPATQTIMPVNGPGITHICFQSSESDSAYWKFQQGGMKPVSRGSKPVKLSRSDITYAYGRDTAGNMFEMEQWETSPKPFPIWIAHVALVSHDIERLANFYSTIILGLENSPAIRRINAIPTLDIVANLDDVDLFGTWIPTPNILIEIWQFVNPATPIPSAPRSAESLGYSHICFEVDDLMVEYERMRQLGVLFLSEPCQFGPQRLVYGRDPDGNLFELLEFLDEKAPLSLDRLDFG